jgi:lipoyl(octanoyl) transferase
MPPSDGPWHLFVEPLGRPGGENMAFDQALLDEAARSGTSFLHFYRWSPACLSFGRNEPALRRYDREAIERLGIDVVRRPTGGRAVWHSQEVTYAVAAPVAAFGSLRESYEQIHARLAAGLRELRVQAALAHSSDSAPLTGGACYALAIGGEIVVRGRKLVGSAQVRQGDAFLQHGSILLDGSQDVVAAVSREHAGVSDHTTLSEELGRGVTFAEVVDAICDTWPEPLTSPNLYPPPPASNHTALPVWRR